MVSEQLEVTCEKPDKQNRRRVRVGFGNAQHVDRFDIDLQFSRTKWRNATIDKLGLDDSAHEFLETDIFRAAKIADQSNGTLWEADAVSLANIETKTTEWLWDQYLPAGAIVVIDGDPGLGKSQFTVDLAARISRGDTMPPTTGLAGATSPAGTLILNAEDDPARTLKPRLEAAEAIVEKIHLLRNMRLEGYDERPVSLPTDLPAVADKIARDNIRLVVIDPFVAYLAPDLSMNNDADVRRCLGEVAKTAEQTGATFLLVRHLNKKSGQDAKYRGGGSIGITGAARAVFMVGVDPTDDDSRILAPVKCNLAPEPPSLRFHIETVGNTSRVCWGESCDVRASDLLGGDKGDGGGSKLEQAKGIITDVLSSGPRGSNEVMQACLDQGVSKRTYHTARKSLDVASEKTEFQGQWMLTLPSSNGQGF